MIKNSTFQFADLVSIGFSPTLPLLEISPIYGNLLAYIQPDGSGFAPEYWIFCADILLHPYPHLA
jgi:hypothetical protein